MVLGALAQAYPGRSDLEEILSEWEVVPYLQDGQLVGAACIKGSEFHCHTTPAFRFLRSSLRDFLAPLHARHGMLTTRVVHADTANQRFNFLFGFRRTWSDATYHYFIMADLPFGRESKQCQQ